MASLADLFLAMVGAHRVILAARHKLAGRRQALSYLTIGFALPFWLSGVRASSCLSYVHYFWLMLGWPIRLR